MTLKQLWIPVDLYRAGIISFSISLATRGNRAMALHLIPQEESMSKQTNKQKQCFRLQMVTFLKRVWNIHDYECLKMFISSEMYV